MGFFRKNEVAIYELPVKIGKFEQKLKQIEEEWKDVKLIYNDTTNEGILDLSDASISFSININPDQTIILDCNCSSKIPFNVPKNRLNDFINFIKK